MRKNLTSFDKIAVEPISSKTFNNFATAIDLLFNLEPKVEESKKFG